MRKGVLALAVLGLLVAAVLLMRGASRPTRAVDAARAPVEREAHAAPVELATANGIDETRAAVEVAPGPAPAQAVVEETNESAPAPLDAAAGRPLAGTITVTDPDGVEHPQESGTLTLLLRNGTSGRWHEVEVHDGRWRTTLPADEPCEALGVQSATLGGRLAVYGDGNWQDRIEMPADGWLALTVRWLPTATLTVRDRASGRDLAPVLIAEVGRWPESDYGHPGADAVERDLGPSPVALPPREHFSGKRPVFVRSPGYAWSRVEVDESQGGERVVLLDPAGALEVVISGAVTDPGTELRLFGRGFQPAFVASLAGLDRSAVLVEALAPDSYSIRAEIGHFWDKPLVLGETKAEVVAGSRAQVTLELRTIEAPDPVELAGVVVVPAEWEARNFSLWIELLDTALGGAEENSTVDRSEMEPTGIPDAWRWSTTVQPGRVHVSVFPAQWDPKLGIHVT